MDGLTQITTQIIDDAQLEATALLEQTRLQVLEINARYIKQAEEIAKVALEQARTDAKHRIDRAVSQAEMEARKTILTVKQEIVSSIFTEAQTHLLSLEESAYREFLINLAIKGSQSHTEEILFNEKDRALYGSFVVNEANQRLTQAGSAASLTLHASSLPISGGLILKEGPIETVCTFEVLISDCKNRLTGDIVALLFNT